METQKTKEELLAEIEDLRNRLQEADEVLRAIRGGEVDAIVVTRPDGDQIALILSPASGSFTEEAREPARSGTLVARSVQIDHMEHVMQRRRDISRSAHHRIFWGESKTMERVRDLIESAAANDSTILLQGETGTGKSVLARWIYEHGVRKTGPFVEINCAGLKGELLGNELFGHVRGAFTSATENKQGLLDVANGGTLFLDEIGDMDLAVQSQFLKVLEEKRYRRLGDVCEQESEFRLICATGRNLAQDIQEGKFRKDLFYRIHIFPIEIPPLREHPEDVQGLAQSLLQSIGRQAVAINSSAMRLLRNYSWPGNIRELRNVLERALLLCHGDELRPEHFPGVQSTEEQASSDQERIEAAIAKFKGNKRRAAEFLGMSRITLYRKLKNN